jgi:hypothetical protein
VQSHRHRGNPYIKLGERHRDVETENESDIATNVRLGGFGPSNRVASGLLRGGRIRRMRRFFCLGTEIARVKSGFLGAKALPTEVGRPQPLIGSDKFGLGVGVYQDLGEVLARGREGFGAPLAHSDAVTEAVAFVECHRTRVGVAVDFAEAAGKR